MNKKIRELRKKMFPGRGGATICAEKFGVGRQYWYDWESGKKTPGARNQQKLAEFFGVTVAELRGEPGGKKAPDVKAPGAEPPTADDVVAACLEVQAALADVLVQLNRTRDLASYREDLEDLASSVRTLQTLLSDV